MATGEQLTVSSATQESRAIATITIAFSDDPAVRWFIRDPDRYLTFWPQFVRAFAGRAFESGTAHSIGDYGGIAMWLPPGVTSDEETMGALAAEAVPAAEQDDVFAFFDQMGSFHPTDEHWYLPLMGVDVMSRNRGYGSALLRHALGRCDEDEVSAYLEATAPRNKALYERHGFEALGVIQAGSSPPMWPMLRKPRA
jgi:ribosomal protein S18 acetylase RimI-like enzyme